MKFGVSVRNRLTGADLAVRVYQVISILPVLYLLVAAGYPALFASRNLFSFLFDLGVSALPRAEALCAAFVYRMTASEIVFSMAFLVLALAVGLIANRVLHGERARIARMVYAALIGADLLIRLIPLHVSGVFGMPVTILAFLIRLGCLALILLDLRAER